MLLGLRESKDPKVMMAEVELLERGENMDLLGPLDKMVLQDVLETLDQEEQLDLLVDKELG